MIEDDFEWDDQKAATNHAKHGVTFKEASLAVADYFAVEEEDHRKDYGEARRKLVGMAQAELLTIIYTERDNKIRIISARRANKRERKDYYRTNQKEW